MTVDTISRAERGKAVPHWKTLRAFCELFGIAFEQIAPLLEHAHEEGLKGGMRIVAASKAQDEKIDANVEPYSEEKVPSIPQFEADLAAGAWTDVPQMAVCDPRQIDHGIFRVRLRGDSMTPDYKDGQIAEFQCLRCSRDGIVKGEDYYVQRSDGTATFKRVDGFSDEELVLRAINRKKFPKPMRVPWDEVVRLAVYTGEFKPKKPKNLK